MQTKNSLSVGNKNLAILDGLRGLAALYVLVLHAKLLLWEGYNDGYLKHTGEYNFLEKIVMYLLGPVKYGHGAVLFFFVLSGFVIHFKYSKQIYTHSFQRFNFWNYLKRRAQRIYPPFIFSIIIAFVCDSLNKHYHFPTWYSVGSTDVSALTKEYSLSVRTLIGNLFFLYETYFPVWGSNQPLWSLKYEWWFYMIYPIFFLLNKRSVYGALLVVFLLFVASFFPQYWPNELVCEIFSLLFAWWLGTFMADIYTGRVNIKFKYLTPLLVFLPFAALLKLSVPEPLILTLWAIGFCGLLATLFALQEKNHELKFLQKIKALGSFSYTIYIIHLPVLALMSGYIRSKYGELPKNFGYMFFGIALVISISYLAHFLVEKPFLKKK